MKKTVAVVLMSLVLAGCADESSREIPTLSTINMANTVSPIIQEIGEGVCGYENVQPQKPGEEWAKGSELIYRREMIEGASGCIENRPGNRYYIRCYDWRWIDGRLFKRAVKDVKLDAYSCIDESQVEIPYHDKRMQTAVLGEIYEA